MKVRLQTGQSTLDKKLEIVLTFTGNPNPQIKGFRQSLPQTIIYRMKANKKNRFNATKSSMQQAERSPNQSLAGIHALLQ